MSGPSGWIRSASGSARVIRYEVAGAEVRRVQFSVSSLGGGRESVVAASVLDVSPVCACGRGLHTVAACEAGKA